MHTDGFVQKNKLERESRNGQSWPARMREGYGGEKCTGINPGDRLERENYVLEITS